MTFSTVITDYLGEGVAADRPVSLNISPTALGLYYSTDTGTLSIWDGSAWVEMQVGPIQDITTITGTTAGTAVALQPWQGTYYKEVLVYFNGYQNATGVAQTYSFPVAFTNAPVFVANIGPDDCTVSTTTLTLPVSMAAAETGWAILKGF